MNDKILSIISNKYSLKELEVKEMNKIKAKGMTFTVQAFHAEGLGHVSVMKAKGFFGLMKMDTVVINPMERDLPLFSYDRIHAMGNDTLYVELYDTFVGECSCKRLQEIKDTYSELPEHATGEHWYDDIMLKESIHKKGKKAQTLKYNQLTEEFLNGYLELKPETILTDTAVKREKASYYVEGLLKNGGPSTDVFKETLGEEKIAYFFRNIFFGTEKG